MIVVWLVAVGCFIISRKSQYGKYLKFATVGGLSTFLCFCLLECKSGVYQTDNIDNSAEGIFNK